MKTKIFYLLFSFLISIFIISCGDKNQSNDSHETITTHDDSDGHSHD